MNKLSTTKSNFLRHGSASLELAMFLPFLCLFLLGIFAVTSVVVSKSDVENEARYAAWKYRHTPWHADQLVSTDIGVDSEDLRILGNRPRTAAGSLVAEEAEKPIQQFLRQLAFGNATSEHFVWSGVWDNREIKFKTHPRLEISDKALYFSNNGIDLSAFKSLGN